MSFFQPRIISRSISSMSTGHTDGDEKYLHYWADRHRMWPLARRWDDYPCTCYVIIIMEAVFVQVTGFLLSSVRAGSSFLSGLSDGISWPLPETALIARLTKNNTTLQKGERSTTRQLTCWGSTGVRMLGPLANLNNLILPVSSSIKSRC